MPTSILFFASRRLYSQYDPPFDLEDSSSVPTKYISTQQHADAMGGKSAVERKKTNIRTKKCSHQACTFRCLLVLEVQNPQAPEEGTSSRLEVWENTAMTSDDLDGHTALQCGE